MLLCYFLPCGISEGCSLIFSFMSFPTYQKEMRGETKECYDNYCHKSRILFIILCVSVAVFFWIL